MQPVARYLSFVLLTLFSTLLFVAPTKAASDREGILVGRIAHVEGQLLRYIEEEKDWVQTVQDAPFGLQDALYAGDDTRAELIMPNGSWMRIGEHTQVQLINLDPDATTVDVASGLARLYNRSRDTVIKVTTPFGYAVAPAGSAVDLYVGDESLEVIAVRGEVDFVHQGTGRRYPIREGADSIIADRQTTARGNGAVDGPWEDWNDQRERVWAERQRARSASAEFLPEPIRDNAYVLEDNGRWERVYYDGDYRDMWRPTRVDPGWRPYTSGRWVVYYGDNCWIPDNEPFGYVTHHYGSWVYVDSFRSWYWMPPVARRYSTTPTLLLNFGWYPGRVGWFHSHDSVGWVPLAPHETYYGYRPWGHRTVVIHRSKPIRHINMHRYRYLDEAVVVHRDHLYRGHRYTPDMRRHIDKKAILNNYKPTTVINKTVIKNFNTDKRRFAFGDAEVGRKPHATVSQRIDTNRRMVRDDGRLNRDRIERDLKRVRTSNELPTRTDVRAPALTPKLVDADKTKAPIDKSGLPQKEIKPRERERRLAPGERSGFEPQRRGGEEQWKTGGQQAGKEEERGLRSPRDDGAEKLAPQGGASRDQGGTDQRLGPAAQQDNQRLRSPRERQQPQERPDGTGAGQQIKGKGPTPPDQEVFKRNRGLSGRDEEKAQRSTREWGGQQEMRQPSDKTPPVEDSGRTGPRGQEGWQQQRGTLDQQQNQRLRAPKATAPPQESTQQQQEQANQRRIKEQQRQAEERRQRQQTIFDSQREPDWSVQREERRQQPQVDRQRQEELQQRQHQEMKQRQVEEQRRQQQDVQRRQQEAQQRQEQEMQRRRQMEADQRQQETLRRQKQEAVERRPLQKEPPAWQQQQQQYRKPQAQEQQSPAKKKPTPEELLQLQQQGKMQ